MREEERRGPVTPHRVRSDAEEARSSESASASAPETLIQLSPLTRLTKPELERRIALLERQATRYPKLAEACLLERDRLSRVLAEKRAVRAYT
jgi:hypothetical protein